MIEDARAGIPNREAQLLHQGGRIFSVPAVRCSTRPVHVSQQEPTHTSRPLFLEREFDIGRPLRVGLSTEIRPRDIYEADLNATLAVLPSVLLEGPFNPGRGQRQDSPETL